MGKTIIGMGTKSAMPGRFKCYVCDHEHLLKKMKLDIFKVPEDNTEYVFERGSGCRRDDRKMKEMIDHRDGLIFYGQLHEVLDSYRQAQIF